MISPPRRCASASAGIPRTRMSMPRLPLFQNCARAFARGRREDFMAAVTETKEQVAALGEKYKYGFVTDIETERAAKGLSEETVKFISAKKDEPEWMLEW